MPSHQRVRILAVHSKTFAAGVRNGTNRFLHQQAFCWNGQIDTSPRDRSGQSKVVAVGIVTEQRKHETVFAACGAVATAGIATRTHEYGHDVQLETDWWIGLSVFDNNGKLRGVACEFNFQLRLAVGNGMQHGAICFCELVVGQSEFGLRGDVVCDSVSHHALHQDRLPISQRS